MSYPSLSGSCVNNFINFIKPTGIIGIANILVTLCANSRMY